MPCAVPAPEQNPDSKPEALALSLPAPGAPFLEVRALRAERRVASMPRIHPGGVRQPVEHLRLHSVEQRREPGRVLLGVAHAAGEL